MRGKLSRLPGRRRAFSGDGRRLVGTRVDALIARNVVERKGMRRRVRVKTGPEIECYEDASGKEAAS